MITDNVIDGDIKSDTSPNFSVYESRQTQQKKTPNIFQTQLIYRIILKRIHE